MHMLSKVVNKFFKQVCKVFMHWSHALYSKVAFFSSMSQKLTKMF